MSQIAKLVLRWNNLWIYDYWYRKKHNIPFNSKEHRELNQIDIKFAYEEEIVMNNERIKHNRKKKDLQHYKDTGEWLKRKELSKELEDELFDLI